MSDLSVQQCVNLWNDNDHTFLGRTLADYEMRTMFDCGNGYVCAPECLENDGEDGIVVRKSDRLIVGAVAYSEESVWLNDHEELYKCSSNS